MIIDSGKPWKLEKTVKTGNYVFDRAACNKILRLLVVSNFCDSGEIHALARKWAPARRRATRRRASARGASPRGCPFSRARASGPDNFYKETVNFSRDHRRLLPREQVTVCLKKLSGRDQFFDGSGPAILAVV